MTERTDWLLMMKVQPGNAAEAAYLRAPPVSMEASSGTHHVRLPMGDLVVLNNYFYVHVRALFKRNAGLSRELMRQRGVFARSGQEAESLKRQRWIGCADNG